MKSARLFAVVPVVALVATACDWATVRRTRSPSWDDLILELVGDDISIPKDSVVQQTLNELLLTSSPAGG